MSGRGWAILAVWLTSWTWLASWWHTVRRRDFDAHAEQALRTFDIPAEDRPDWGQL